LANRIITAVVTGENIKLSNKVAGAEGSFNAVSLSLTFDSTWDGTTKKMYFFDVNGANAVYRLLTTDLIVSGAYIVPIPAEPLAYPGEMTITIRGIDLATDGTTAERIIMSASTTMKVLSAIIPETDVAPEEPTPTQAEQLQAEIDDIKDTISDAEDAATAAQAAQAAAELALTHAPYVDDTTHNWFIWNAEIGAYENSGDYSIGPPGAVYQADEPTYAVLWIDSDDDAISTVTKSDIGLGNVDNTSDLSKPISTATQTALNLKVDKIAGKGLSTEDYTSTEKSKLSGIAENANNYVHPANHAPSIITQDANNRFVTDTEKSTWNGKQDALGFTPVPNTRTVNSKVLSADITLSTADIADSTDKRYCTDAQKTIIGNTSGANTGDETTATIKSKLGITTLSGSNTGDQTIPIGGSPSITLGTANAAGSAATFVKTDATILAFDTTAPTTQAYGDSAAVGTATVAARRDHKHAMPASTKDTTAQTGILYGNGSAISVASNSTAVLATSGTNTGDETTATIKSKLGISTLSGSNTGDQTLAGLGGLALSGGTMTGAINEALIMSMALAGTMDIGAQAGNYIIVTAGTGPITSFGTVTQGASRRLRFSVAATITYNATTMILMGGQDLVLASGDVVEFTSGGGGIWRCTRYTPFNPLPIKYGGHGGATASAARANLGVVANVPAQIINGNFLCPVNQRNVTSGTAFSTAGAYFMDMWKLVSGSVTWTSGTGISLNGVLKQYFEILPANLYSKILPVTINVGGTEYVLSMTFPATNTGSAVTATAGAVTVTIGFESYAATLCGISTTYVPYITFTTSVATTIAYAYSDKFPSNYGEQLNLCQEFFVRYTTSGNINIANGNGAISTAINFIVPIPTTMRISPSVAVGSLSNIVCRNGQTDLAISGLAPNAMVPSAVYMTATVAGATQGAMYQLRITNADHIDFSAEL